MCSTNLADNNQCRSEL